MRVLTRDAAAHVDREITVMGWAHRLRELGAISFVLVRDRSGMIQVVFEGKAGFTHESVISVRGTVRRNEKAPGGFEIAAAAFDVLALADSELPLPVNGDPDKVSLDALLDNRMISLRMPRIRSIFRVQSTIIKAFAESLRGLDFTEIKTSKLVGSGTEGGTGLFTVEYFDGKVFLAQSPQFYKQALVSSGMERVFEIGAAYRAEKHDTPRHLNEYVSLDVEMAFIQSEHELMDLELGILKSVFAALRAENAEDLAVFGASLPDDAAIDRIPRVGYEEAKDIISASGGKKVFDINPEGERVLCDWAREKHGVDAAFVNAFPRKKRPFYAFPDGLKTMSFDLLFRGLEITTGGRRINEYAMLLDALPKFGLTPEAMGAYMDIFRCGCPPHGGFAIGLERLTQKILGLHSVKEASLFPRDRKRTTP
ncbi:MAG: aspartate--tRNA(Asn) ligase [Spirochaetales bacterium]|jgi:nondiscriminating aspartyl-tRNA synthetase|nr:aspartate--tRNA(Asn) ligase [Spirochaetales bacterium]